MMSAKIVLICKPLRFYTNNDEDLFFNWLKKIECIKNYEGVGNSLQLHITSKKISNNDLLELFGLFDRYKFDSKQLAIFKNESNKEWFDE
jgi:hypothetical protein